MLVVFLPARSKLLLFLHQQDCSFLLALVFHSCFERQDEEEARVGGGGGRRWGDGGRGEETKENK